MRKIQTPEEIEKSQKRTKIILSIFILLLLVLSTLGFAVLNNPSSSNPSTKEDNKLDNALEQNTFNINGQQLTFSFTPQAASFVSVNISKNINNYASQQVYISSDNQAVSSEIASTLGRFTSRLQEACYGSCSLDLPEKTCQDNLIVINSSEIRSVSQQDNCIFISDTLSADAFLYKIFGII